MKRLWLFVGVSIGISLFTTAPSLAVSPHVVIRQLQTGGSGTGTASQEVIVLENTSLVPVDVTNWCLDYITASAATITKLSCLEAVDSSTRLKLAAGSHIVLATNEFVAVQTAVVADELFSAGLSATGGHVRVRDADGFEVDRLGWGTATQPEGLAVPAPAGGQVLTRLQDTDSNLLDFTTGSLLTTLVVGLYEEQVIVDVCPNILEVQAVLPDGYLTDESGDCYADVCHNVTGLQKTVPNNYELLTDQVTCQLIPLEDSELVLTELLPNVTSYDTGLEFIELYNPNSYPVLLDGYTLLLGPALNDSYVFSSGVIEPGQYVAFYDGVTGMTLPNTTAYVRLVSPAGSVVSETPAYNEPKDDISWANYNGEWIMTNQPSPSSANLPYLIAAEPETQTAVAYAACPEGKYRNPETNRCRTIERAVSVLAPCDEDEERNPLTNRCRKITVISLVACKPGQERNPLTNRCRLVTSNDVEACPEGQERNPETNRCRKMLVVSDAAVLGTVSDVPAPIKASMNAPLVGLVIGGTLGYILYEWRVELNRLIRRYLYRK